MARSGSIRQDNPYATPITGQSRLRLVKSDVTPAKEQTKNIVFDDGVISVDNPDGTTTFTFGQEGSSAGSSRPHDSSHEANLAFDLDEGDLAKIASELLDGVQRDELSRREWMETRALGIQLLGLKLEKPRSDLGNSSAPLEGMSTVRHPVLLDATVHFQATARAELLPASGPVKVRNDTPTVPRGLMSSPNSTDPENPYPTLPPPQATSSSDERAQALESDLNHYLLTQTNYVADTDRMLFYVGFGGDGFKKVYSCPLRRMPVSESVDAEDLIVSDSATDLNNCGRLTHRIKMRKSVLKRMQINGEYRECDLAPPTQTTITSADKEKNQIAGFNPSVLSPEDRDYEILEIYCELDLDEFAPERFKNKGLPLPYRVTIERQSRQILDIKRNWKKSDKECRAKEYFVQFPMVRGLGFYGLGYIHLLGNTCIALTAAWRLQLDNGMFSNFPGFLYAKGIGRQLTNQFRVPPGGGIGLEIGSQQSIKDAVMPLPYKETGPAFTQFTTHVEEVAQRLAQTGSINVGEGKQDAPVGTTLALIEQATKVMDSAHKRLHAAQDKELKLLVERFREDPEAFFRHCKTKNKWEKKQFLEALDDYHIVPVADPNNPTSLHRLAKAMAIKELQKGNPNLYDPVAVDLRVMQIADIDPSGLFRQQPQNPAPDPRLVAIQQKADSVKQQNQIQLLEAQIKAASEQAKMQDNVEERASREKLEQMKIQLELLKIKEEGIIHQQQMANDTQQAHHKMAMDQASKQQDLQMDAMSRQHEIHADREQQKQNLYTEAMKQHGQIQMEGHKHQATMARENQKHVQEMQQARERHEVELEASKKIAEEQAKATGPSEEAKTKREDEAHKQKLGHNDEKLKMEKEKHRVGLSTSKKMADAKVTATKKSAKDKPAKKDDS